MNNHEHVKHKNAAK